MTESKHDVNGLILAGGASSRMGMDKSLLDYHGQPQREYLFSLLQPVCLKVFLSCSNATGVPQHLNPIVDQFDIKGPMNGILSAFSNDNKRALLTLPVDMPNIDRNIIMYLLSGRDPSATATCFYDSAGVDPEPLVAIWEPRAVTMLMEDMQKGRTSPRDFLRRNRVKLLRPPTPLFHVNVNSPEDLRKYTKPPYSS
ncbi:MAG TPA: molybdenum cofactor guanylyltransferase [Chryseosolibacter sp.]|nr:molybdenum cofactor guanylyltransferase [Chryseosolibacter sp.]